MAAEQHSTSGIAYGSHLNMSLPIGPVVHHNPVVVPEGVLKDLMNFSLFFAY
jgi:hypothetical protein